MNCERQNIGVFKAMKLHLSLIQTLLKWYKQMLHLCSCAFFPCSASCKTMQREYNKTCDGDFLTLGITSSLPCSKQLPVERAPSAHLHRENNDVSYTVSGRNNCFLLALFVCYFWFWSQLKTIPLLEAGHSSFIILDQTFEILIMVYWDNCHIYRRMYETFAFFKAIEINK